MKFTRTYLFILIISSCSTIQQDQNMSYDNRQVLKLGMGIKQNEPVLRKACWNFTQDRTEFTPAVATGHIYSVQKENVGFVRLEVVLNKLVLKMQNPQLIPGMRNKSSESISQQCGQHYVYGLTKGAKLIVDFRLNNAYDTTKIEHITIDNLHHHLHRIHTILESIYKDYPYDKAGQLEMVPDIGLPWELSFNKSAVERVRVFLESIELKLPHQLANIDFDIREF